MQRGMAATAFDTHRTVKTLEAAEFDRPRAEAVVDSISRAASAPCSSRNAAASISNQCGARPWRPMTP